MSDYKELLNPLLQDVEGSSSDAYQDHNGNPTVGSGFNLNDQENQAILKTHGIDPEAVKSGQRSLSPDESQQIQDAILARKERLVRGKVGSDLFDTLTPEKKATLMSLGYQSLNNIGPHLQGYVANDDDIGALRELILKTNKEQDPGILARRMKEAQLYGGKENFQNVFMTLSPEEKQMLAGIINKTQNENTRKQLVDSYGQQLGMKSRPLNLQKLAKMMK